MSIQDSIELAIKTQLELAIPGIVVVTGPTTTPEAEGSERFAAVRRTSAAGARLEFAQTLWTESYALTLFWHARTVPRATVIDEWENVQEAFAADPQLFSQSVTETVERSYLSSTLWGEAADSHFRTMTATLVVERVE